MLLLLYSKIKETLTSHMNEDFKNLWDPHEGYVQYLCIKIHISTISRSKTL